MQTRDLARSSREQDFPPFRKEASSIFVRVCNASLDIFATHEGLHALHGVGIIDKDLPVAVESGSEDNSPLLYRSLRKQMEKASGRRFHPHGLIPVHCGKHLQRFDSAKRMEFVADLFAQAAIDASPLIGFRVKETLAVCLHGDTSTGTDRSACAAAAAIMFIGNMYHFLSLITRRALSRIKNLSFFVIPMKNAQSPTDDTQVKPTAMNLSQPSSI